MSTEVAIRDNMFFVNGRPTYEGVAYQGRSMGGRLFNVRMVNATFEDKNPATAPPDFSPDANTAAFIAAIPQYKACGIAAFTLNLQGGHCGYENPLNSAFAPDGSLIPAYMTRVKRVLDACDEAGMVVILGLFYQRQCRVFADEEAIRNAVRQAMGWLKAEGYRHVMIEIANEYSHGGFRSVPLIQQTAGELELIRLARRVHPELLISTSGTGGGRFPAELAAEADFVIVHADNITVPVMVERLQELLEYGKPVVFNEDNKLGSAGAEALTQVALHGGSWGYMNTHLNQYYPFQFGIAPGEDALVYQCFAEITGHSEQAASLAAAAHAAGLHLTIVEPGDGAEVHGKVPFTVAVTPAEAVASLEYFIDGKLADTRCEPPFRFAGSGVLDTDQLGPGVHNLTVRATSKAGEQDRDFTIDIVVRGKAGAAH